MIQELRAARRDRGLSQRSLADLIGVDVQQIKRVERGGGSVRTFVAMADALDFRLVGIGSAASLPEQLVSRRRALRLSAREVSRRAGLARSTLRSLEGGGGAVASLLRLLAVIAPTARRRAPERAYWGRGDKEDRDSRFTPPEFLDDLHAAFGAIDLDPCGHPLSPVVAARRIMKSEGGDGLVEEWSGGLVFVNPPFSELLSWLKRAHEQWSSGRIGTVVCLVPVRTDSAWFHEVLSGDASIYLLRGRLRFVDPRGGRQSTPFSLMVVALGATEQQKARFASLVPGFWMKPG